MYTLSTGEILVRKSLEKTFKALGVSIDVMRSDEEFEWSDIGNYDIIILDPWTWAAKGKCKNRYPCPRAK